jgi:hypothetical protein
MARKLRVECPGTIYHAMNPGDRRETIFKDDQDRPLFSARSSQRELAVRSAQA